MSLDNVLDNLPEFHSDEIIKSFVKGYTIINRPMYKNIVCSISGGSDSDIVLDIVHRIDEQKKVRYVWFDTGLEYKATKEHLDYLEERYGVQIERKKAIKSIPYCCKEYGQPFVSKRVSDMIERLQRNGFMWEDDTFENLYRKYPKCKASLRWWCNNWGEGSKFNIRQNKWLKEFMIENPPKFKISQKCCRYAKKKVVEGFIDQTNADLNIYGVRKAEGGARSSAYKNCYTDDNDGIDQYRPIFWFKEYDKKQYENAFNIVHSDCYTKYGLLRTGCVGCPFGRNCTEELDTAMLYEPSLGNAVINVFKDSYEYTKEYREFQKKLNRSESDQMTFFD